ncbi:MAG: Uncharacterized protein CEO12_400 [Parcubacteria group bacterium Gr01-1014_46]|nr:MAG: Uncharacterized protein CEO12_400 [Parcubacteria group bacterium Gr01-1014_46]
MSKYIKNLKIKRPRNVGFTIVETLVAISILTLSILAGFTAVQNSLRSSISAKDQIVAFYLTQEAMEYIKNIRDQNALNFLNGDTSYTWLTGLSESSTAPCWHGGGGPAKSCIIDVTASPPNDIVNCTGTCPQLRRDPVTGLMGYNSGWTLTNFSRYVQFQNVVDGEEVRVIITISWIQGATTKTFQVTESLFNRLQ